ncbi:LysM peptidoglycan-binding domain-containing protein [Patescibacteria group bacterium]|nr:LysM peptidoglycan-binding domain-containing protein [Patescibacteria group bacterium]
MTDTHEHNRPVDDEEREEFDGEEFDDDDLDEDDEFVEDLADEDEFPDESADEDEDIAATVNLAVADIDLPPTYTEEVTGRSRWSHYAEIMRDLHIGKLKKVLRIGEVSFRSEYRRGTSVALGLLLLALLIAVSNQGAVSVPDTKDGQETGVLSDGTPTPDSPSFSGSGEGGGVVIQGVGENMGGGVPIQPTPEVPGTRPPYHVVQQGENLFRIGLRYGFTPEELALYNSIPDPNYIVIGQQINLPPGPMPGATGGGEPPVNTQVGEVTSVENAIPAVTTERPRSSDPLLLGTMLDANHYVVNQGDTLFSLSQRFNVPMEQLMAWNGITDPNVLTISDILQVSP